MELDRQVDGHLEQLALVDHADQAVVVLDREDDLGDGPRRVLVPGCGPSGLDPEVVAGPGTLAPVTNRVPPSPIGLELNDPGRSPRRRGTAASSARTRGLASAFAPPTAGAFGIGQGEQRGICQAG